MSMWVSVCVSCFVDELLDKQKPPFGVPMRLYRDLDTLFVSDTHTQNKFWLGLLPKKLENFGSGQCEGVRAAGLSAAAGLGSEDTYCVLNSAFTF